MTRTISLILLFTCVLILAGCGAETVGTAAIVAKQKQQEIEEGQKLKDSVLQQLDAAQALEEQRLKEAEGR
jgi:outer membrane lipopolysaccharide assembly protein LptE/RlpB